MPRHGGRARADAGLFVVRWTGRAGERFWARPAAASRLPILAVGFTRWVPVVATSPGTRLARTAEIPYESAKKMKVAEAASKLLEQQLAEAVLAVGKNPDAVTEHLLNQGGSAGAG